jgi:hypothetical protein
MGAGQHQRARRLGQGQHRRAAAGNLAGRDGDVVVRALQQIPERRAHIAERHQKRPAGADDLGLQPHDRLARGRDEMRRIAADHRRRDVLEAVERARGNRAKAMLGKTRG